MIGRLKSQLANDGTVTACWCAYGDPQIAGDLAQQGFDAVVLDGQHGFHDTRSVLDCIPSVVLAGKAPVVRIPPRRWDMVESALDHGALGIVAPMINNREDAEMFARSAKYPRSGTRSYGPRHAAGIYGLSSDEYIAAANGATVALAQVETRESYDNLDDILAIDGIDGILMGPSDFSIFVTGNPKPDPYGEGTIELVKEIAKRTRAAGKIAAAFTASPTHAKLVHDAGYRFISVAMDTLMIGEAGSRRLNELDF